VQLTKYTHSCVRLDDGYRSLAIDPGVFSEVQAALDGVSAVLITHEHVDHLQVEELRSALQRDSRLRMWAPAVVAESFSDQFGEQVVTASPGQALDAGGFAVRTFGGQHALIHPSIPVIANVGYLVEESVYHPGDSFTVPPVAVQLLLAPIHAPWSKTAEVIDFVVSVRAPRAIGIHDALLTDAGRQLVESHVARIGGEHGSDYTAVRPGETMDV
jgi:L-ascorbate metabolism protein UlaG (beta-lactamase superfamily)